MAKGTAEEIKEAIKEHTRAITRDVRSFPVPEWLVDGEPLVIYHTPLTLSEKGKILDHREKGGLDWMVHLIIMKAKDADGKSIFNIGHKLALIESFSETVEWIALKLMNTSPGPLPGEFSPPGQHTQTPGNLPFNTASPSASVVPSENSASD